MNQAGFDFEVVARADNARAASYTTPHGTLQTPAFVAVGTQATIKSLSPQQVENTQTQLLFANTYHLYLRPGQDIVAAHGGLHEFMNWQRPIMTDSGGFQVFSLGASIEHGVGKVANIFPGEERTTQNAPRLKEGKSLVKVGEHEVRFKSHLDGSSHVFTPEKSIQIQRDLGADMILAFDECTSPLHDAEYTRRSAERTHRWAQRCLEYFKTSEPKHGYDQALYGITQGGAFESVRRESTQMIAGMGFDGIAIGGNLGKTHEEMYQVLDWSLDYLPEHKPRHLLGIGDVPSIFEGVARGMDTFDCVSPTRNARNGALLRRFDDEGKRLPRFRVNASAAVYAEDTRPPDENCDCYTCQTFSRAYLRHLFKAGERLAETLATIHNLRFMAKLLEDIRESIKAGEFQELKREWLEP